MQIATQQANQNASRSACNDPPLITMTTDKLLMLRRSQQLDPTATGMLC